MRELDPLSPLTIGSEVHFVLTDGSPRPATVVNPHLDSPSRSMIALNVHLCPGDEWGGTPSTNNLMATTATYEERGRTPGTWHWPSVDLRRVEVQQTAVFEKLRLHIESKIENHIDGSELLDLTKALAECCDQERTLASWSRSGYSSRFASRQPLVHEVR